MKIKHYWMLLSVVLMLNLMLTACSNEGYLHVTYKQDDILVIQGEKFSKSEHTLLHNSPVESASFSAATGFVPDERWKSQIKVQDEKYTFLDIHSSNVITGTFILDQLERYNGGNLGLVRFFVSNGMDTQITKEIIAKQELFLPENYDTQNISLLPTLSWMGDKFAEPKYMNRNNKLYTTKKVKGLQVKPLPYDTKLDIIWADEFGNTSLLAKDVPVTKNQATSINIEDQILSDIYKNEQRQFLFVFANRNEEILADALALDQLKKPYMTTFQGIIEIYPIIEKN
ncbi:hypothetical protein AYJ08_08865 [Brevibacillus sp. SKDU10]|uniref:hypothetical protein n=1 Tax=Brevibacillus sp. SKDU10 TaxID=1247872 RepID=UPI0007C94281|nr:hypothetical protein [Brevibacillus sp. SKDU10]OAJ74401.1 hypothetical protein AYJ08_08865 [Brevibacillus sp. SKDU10]